LLGDRGKDTVEARLASVIRRGSELAVPAVPGYWATTNGISRCQPLRRIEGRTHEAPP